MSLTDGLRALRRAAQLIPALLAQGVSPAHLFRTLWARYRTYGFQGLMARAAHWTHVMQLSAAGPNPERRLQRLAALTHAERRALARLAVRQRGPDLAILLTVDAAGLDALPACLASLQAQPYRYWRLWVQAAPALRDAVLARCQLLKLKPKWLEHLEPPPGTDWCLLLSATHQLREDALQLMGAVITTAPRLTLLYTDEVVMDATGQPRRAEFKPDWNPEWLLEHNYIGEALLVRSHDWRLTLQSPVPVPTSAETALSPADRLLLALPRTSARHQVWHLPYLLLRRCQSDPSPAPGARMRHWLPARLPLISIIIPTRNRRLLLQSCLDSLFAHTDYPCLEILVIDNGSDDPATRRYLRQLAQRPSCRVLTDPRPFNFAALNNAAVAQARGEFVLLLNNDTEVLHPDWLKKMLAWVLRPGVGAVGARLLYPDATLQHGGVVLGIMGGVGHDGRGQPAAAAGPGGRYRVTRRVGAVTGACLLVSRAHYLAVGGMDAEAFPVALNDVDFCLRLQARGLAVIWTPQAELLHRESKTRGRDADPARAQRFALELARLKQRWGARLNRDPAYNPNLTCVAEDASLPWPGRLARSVQLLNTLLSLQAEGQHLDSPEQAPWWNLPDRPCS